MTETNKTKEEKKVISIYQINTQLNELKKDEKKCLGKSSRNSRN